MVESPPVHLGREASVSGSSAPVSGLDVGWRWITVDMIFAVFNSWMMVNDWRSGW